MIVGLGACRYPDTALASVLLNGQRRRSRRLCRGGYSSSTRGSDWAPSAWDGLFLGGPSPPEPPQARPEEAHRSLAGAGRAGTLCQGAGTLTMLGLVEREGLVSLAVERHSAARGGTPPHASRPTAAGAPGPPPGDTAAAGALAPARRTRGVRRPFVLQSHLTERHVDTLLARSTTHDDRAVVCSDRAEQSCYTA